MSLHLRDWPVEGLNLDVLARSGEKIPTPRRGPTPADESTDEEEEPTRPTEPRSSQTERGRKPRRPRGTGALLECDFQAIKEAHGPIHPKLAKKTVLFSITYIHKAGGEVRVKG
jgi:hypothetical protein